MYEKIENLFKKNTKQGAQGGIKGEKMSVVRIMIMNEDVQVYDLYHQFPL